MVVDPEDYTWIAQKIQSGGFGSITKQERKNLAVKAFQVTLPKNV